MVMVERDGNLIAVPGAWAPPSHTILPEKLEQARGALEHMLKPAGDEGVGKAMMPLMLTQVMPNTEGMGDQTMQAFFAAKASEYQRHLREIPLDILKAAADACARKSKFFPAVAELFEAANDEWEKRKRQADRVRRLIAGTNAPKQAAPFKPAPEEERLPLLIKSARIRGDILAASRYAQRLAELTGAPLPDWAVEQATRKTPPPMSAPPKPKAEAPTIEGDFERVEEPPTEQDEPPMPDEIPE